MPWWDENTADEEPTPQRVPTVDSDDEEYMDDEVPNEKTKLLGFGVNKKKSDEKDESDNNDDDDDGEEYQYHSDYALLPESLAYNAYRWFSGVAAVLAFIMLILQLVSFATLGGDETGKFFTESLIRTFCVVFCALFFFVEIPITSRLAGWFFGLQNWVFRGFLWCFVAVVSAEAAQASLFANFPQIPGFQEHVTVLVLKMTASIMVGIGIIYMCLGVFCLKFVMEKIIGHYEDHVANRLRNANSDMEHDEEAQGSDVEPQNYNDESDLSDEDEDEEEVPQTDGPEDSDDEEAGRNK